MRPNYIIAADHQSSCSHATGLSQQLQITPWQSSTMTNLNEQSLKQQNCWYTSFNEGKPVTITEVTWNW